MIKTSVNIIIDTTIVSALWQAKLQDNALFLWSSKSLFSDVLVRIQGNTTGRRHRNTLCHNTLFRNSGRGGALWGHKSLFEKAIDPIVGADGHDHEIVRLAGFQRRGRMNITDIYCNIFRIVEFKLRLAGVGPGNQVTVLV